MKTETHNIDLKKAMLFLSKNLEFVRGESGTNRPVSIRKVNQYAIEMLRGNWRLTHQGIAFDTAGLLKDGQHRLLAIVQAAQEGARDGEEIIPPDPNIKVAIAVTFGLEDGVFDVLDTGLGRNGGQILAIAGYPSQTNLAAAARMLFLYDNYEFRFWRSIKVTNHQVLHTVQTTHIDEYMPTVSPLKPIGFIPAPTTVGYFICERAWKDGPHEEFLEALGSGESMKAGDPRLTLRNTVIKSKGVARFRRDSATYLAYYILAWNDFAMGKRRDAISWRSNMDFPRPVEK